MYTAITVRVIDQALQVTNIPKIASGGVNVNRVEATFCELWEGYGKTACFYRRENQIYRVVMQNDSCIIPWEVLTEPGTLYFFILGTDGVTERPTETVQLTVEKGAITGLSPYEPLPDVYKQVLGAYGGTQQELAVERARINNLATNGGTSSDAELIDVRVGYDGKTHDSAGAAVRAQIGDFSGLVGLSWVIGHYITNTGAQYTNTGRKCSAFIPCAPGITLNYIAETGHASVSGLTFYDADHNVLAVNSNVGANGTICTTTAPEGTRYLRISTSDAIGWKLSPGSPLALAAISQNTADIRDKALKAEDQLAYQSILNGANVVDLTRQGNVSGLTRNSDGSITVAAGGYMFVSFKYALFAGMAHVGIVSNIEGHVGISFSSDGNASASEDVAPYVYTRTLNGMEVATLDRRNALDAYPYAIIRIDNRSGTSALNIRELKIVDSGAPMSSGAFFVSPDGSDDNPGTLQGPFATVNRALLAGASIVYARAGVYDQNIDLGLALFKRLAIKSYDATGRAIFRAPDSLIATQETQVSGYTRVYRTSCSKTFSSTNLWIFQDGVPDARTLISDAERHPLERGQTHRCFDTMIARCEATSTELALQEIEASEDFKWYQDGDVLYFSRPSAVTVTNPLRGSFGAGLFRNGTRGTTLEMTGIESKYQSINPARTADSVLTDCKATNVWAAGAIEYTQCLGVRFIRCEAARCCYGPNGDGFNAHGENTGEPFAKQVTASMVDCWSHDNNDDGYSDHERSEITIIGGLFEYNGKAGVTPSYGSHCTCYGVTSRRNYAGFYCTGAAEAAEGGKYTQMVCHNCIAEGNTRGGTKAGFRVDGAGNSMELIGCLALNNGTGYVIGNPACSGKLINCTGVGNATARSGDFAVVHTVTEAMEQAVSDAKQSLAAIQANAAAATAEALEAAASSAPANVEEAAGDVLVIHDSAHRAVQGLKLYGKTADDMTAVGDVTITTQGKNLYNPVKAERTHPTAVVTVDGDKLHVTTDGTSTYSGAKLAGFRLLAGVTYTLTATVEKVSGSPRICFRKTSGAGMITSKSGTGKLVLTYTPDETVDARVDLLVCEGTAMAGEAIFSDVQLEIGAEAIEYEPYMDGGSVTIPTGGLHGILVARGGNYITDAGAQYIADYIDLAAGERVQMIGMIDSYAGEDVGDVWQSSTGELSTGATVIYALDEPVITPLGAELLAAHGTLCMQDPTTYIITDSAAGMAVSYVTTGRISDNGWYVEPVKSAWEQRMLDRIGQCMLPMAALRDIPKASKGYIRKGQVLTGINYSAVHQDERGKRMVGIQIPLSTYYSALENPASKMYTEDAYQDDNAASSYYGIVCSGFVSYIIGAASYIWTEKMAQLATDGTWSVLDVTTENDLFQVRRGDLLLNTVVTSGSGDHVRIVRDVVHDAKTGRLIGFNVAEAWKPFCLTTFYKLSDILAQMSEAQPYRVVRMDDLLAGSSDYSLDVEPIAYSRTVYPDKGDGGTYTAGEEIWLYLPRASEVESITYGAGVTVSLSDLQTAYVNGVKVYKLPDLGVGTHSIITDSAPDDPCWVTVTE